MTSCNEIAPLLGAFEDGELEPHEMHEIARHLAMCADCEASLRDLATLGRHLRGAVVLPSLDGFAAAVDRRIAATHLPLRERTRRYLDAFNQRWIAALTLSSAALAMGVWTAILVTPAVRDLVGAHLGAPTEVASLNHESESAQNVASGDLSNAAADNGGPTVISRLEAELPSVAVFNEPDTKTTVIWVPDDLAGDD